MSVEVATVYVFPDTDGVWVLHITLASEEAVAVHKTCATPGPLVTFAEKWARDRGFAMGPIEGSVYRSPSPKEGT